MSPVARVAQGLDYAAKDKTLTSVKHFVGYGAAEGGRDYNTTDMSQSTLRNLYLPPFKAAVDAGSDTVMCSFNALNGVDVCLTTDLDDWSYPNYHGGWNPIHFKAGCRHYNGEQALQIARSRHALQPEQSSDFGRAPL